MQLLISQPFLASNFFPATETRNRSGRIASHLAHGAFPSAESEVRFLEVSYEVEWEGSLAVKKYYIPGSERIFVLVNYLLYLVLF